MAEHRSSAWPLTGVAVALIVYASLHPWSGWHWPDRQNFSWLLPKIAHEVPGDLVANILGYVPLGMILCLAWLRSGASVWRAVCWTVLSASALSYGLELIQYTVPGRVPSISDWTLNTLGTAWGCLGAVTVQALGMVDVWHRLRQRWFILHAGHGLALLCLWPMGLLFPPPLPFGEGQLLPHVRHLLSAWTAGTPWRDWLWPDAVVQRWDVLHAQVAASPFLPQVETLTIAVGLLAPVCVAFAMARPKSLRWILLSVLMMVGVGLSAVSAALNFGPEHAFSWVSSQAWIGMTCGMLAGMLLVDRSRTFCAWSGVAVLCVLMALIHLAPPDPYYAQTLQAWQHGRFIRFHGLSRWFGILWPYIALMWLVWRLVAQDLVVARGRASH